MAGLIGRDSETAQLESLLDGASAASPAGGALLVRGEPGIGKSALLEEAAGRGRDRGMLVLNCSGVSGEAHLAFAGLHQMLWPVRADADALPAVQRNALFAALGLVDAPVPGIHLVGLATLELLTECARRAPVLIVVDDVHWLDRPTSEVLAFLALRLHADPVVLAAACRDGEGDAGPLDTAALRELRLGPLDPAAAAALLDSYGRLDPRTRRRVLEVAVGNPLALVELPTALRGRPDDTDPPAWLPLTARLERAYADRLAGLPEASRTALLAAALGGDALAEVLDAASRVAGTEVSAADLAPAVAAGLVEIDAARARFRHPLVRSAVHEAASAARRGQMHAVLAEVLADAPDRAVWHRAAATVGPHEEVAADLARAAARAQLRGATSVAAAALAEAARLTAQPARRGHLLLRAAEQSHELGQWQTTLRLLDQAETLELDLGDQIQLRWFREVLSPASSTGTPPLADFADMADRMRRAGDTELVLDALLRVVMRSWWSSPEPESYRRLAVVAEASAAYDADPRLLNIMALADPLGRAAEVRSRLSDCPPAVVSAAGYLLGLAAQAAGATDQALAFHTAASATLREQGQLGLLGECLLAKSWVALLLGRLDLALAAADEGGRLLAETRIPFWATGTQLVTAIVAGRRGDATTAADLTGRAERVLATAGIPSMLTQVHMARGAAALDAGRFTEAYEQLARVFDPDDITYHPQMRAWALAEYVVAASRSGHQDAARARCAELSEVAAATGSPLLRAGLTIAAPMLADDDDAGALFDEALRADLRAWPLHRARLQLAYGAWLRRHRNVVESRTPLRAARDMFDALGATVEGERARQELRASGEESGGRVPGVLDRLTPQEWHIARLAAQGLSNREIGQQLYLSHRTISSHLYRIFPKLGITSRAELAAVLATAPDAES